MNKAILLGHLTKDPEIRYTQSAEPLAIARYTIAINRRFRRDGEPDADFINCVSFGKQAELLEKYFKKGSKIAVTGRIQVRSFDDPQTNQRRWFTEVVTDDIEFVESKAAFESRMAGGGFGGGQDYGNQGGYNQGFAPDRNAPPAQPPMYEPEGFSAITQSIDDDDLPF